MFKQTNTNNTNDPRPGRKAGHERPTRSTSEKKHARHGDTSRDHAYKAFASSTACRRQRQCNFPSSRHALGDRCCCGSRNRPWHACVCVCVCRVALCRFAMCDSAHAWLHAPLGAKAQTSRPINVQCSCLYPNCSHFRSGFRLSAGLFHLSRCESRVGRWGPTSADVSQLWARSGQPLATVGSF